MGKQILLNSGNYSELSAKRFAETIKFALVKIQQELEVAPLYLGLDGHISEQTYHRSGTNKQVCHFGLPTLGFVSF